MLKSPPPTPTAPRKSVRQHPAYRVVLLCVLVVLLGAMLYLVRSTDLLGGEGAGAPLLESTSDAAGSSSTGLGASVNADNVTSAAGERDRQGVQAGLGLMPGGMGVTGGAHDAATRGNGSGNLNGSGAGGGTASSVEALRQRLEALAGGDGAAVTDGVGEAVRPQQEAGDAGLVEKGDEGGPQYAIKLPDYDREGFAERQRELEALRARTMTDLQSVSPADPEGMLKVIERMSEGLREQGLPNIVDMPKMQAMLLGSKRLNELNTALVAEMGRSGGGRPEEMARLASEITAVQATMPSTVYDLEVVGRLMRGESP